MEPKVGVTGEFNLGGILSRCLVIIVFVHLLVGGCSTDESPRGKPIVGIGATVASSTEEGKLGSFTIFLNKSAVSDMSMDYTVSGTASASDHNVIDGSVFIGTGDSSATIIVRATDDNLEELDETIVLTLAEGADYYLENFKSATVTIPANDTPKATIVATDPFATEAGDPGKFTVYMSTLPMRDKTISFSSSGSATIGSDYLLDESITIAAGNTSGIFSVSPQQDQLPGEGGETVMVTLDEGSSYTVGEPSSATVTIADDDIVTMTVAVTQPDAFEYNVVEGTFTITANPYPTNAMTVNFLVTGTAIEGSDYAAIGSTATIAARQASAVVTITPIDDLEKEETETVILTLNAGTGYTIVGTGNDTARIYDDDKVTIPDLNMILVPIPAGSFTMGSPLSEPYRDAGEGPQHEVTITQDFWMGQTEVTQAQFGTIMGMNPSMFRGDEARPVDGVSWFNARAFCQALTSRESASIPAGYEFRLPTEAEWEYACRAGTTTAFNHGDDSTSDGITYLALGDHAWYVSNSSASTYPVGQKPKNPWGLHDIHGSLWEWCHDWYRDGYYGSSPSDDPTGPSTGIYRMFRGGSWDSTGANCRSAHRGYAVPTYALSNIGLRIVLAPTIP